MKRLFYAVMMLTIASPASAWADEQMRALVTDVTDH